MVEKVACKSCGKLILPTTAKKNYGLCMPCKNGYREQIEKSKEHYKKERELDKTCPFRALWQELVSKVHDSPGGFAVLTEDEKIYFSVGILDGEVYNGGFVQFFDNSSGEYYRYAELGLIRLGAKSSLKLLREAKKLAFGEGGVPKEQSIRWKYVKSETVSNSLDSMDTEYYNCPEDIGSLMEQFALEAGLVKNA